MSDNQGNFSSELLSALEQCESEGIFVDFLSKTFLRSAVSEKHLQINSFAHGKNTAKTSAEDVPSCNV